MENNIMKLIIPFTLVCIAVSTAQDVTYKKTGDSIVLQTENKPEKLNSVVWKHGEDRAAEFYVGDPDISYYRIFEGRSELDNSTCSLTIKNLDKRFNGKYTAEINGLNPTKSETVEVLDPVSTANIEASSECENKESENCTLTCMGTGDGPLTYSWSPAGNGNELKVSKGETAIVYTCKVSNPVSLKEDTYLVPVKESRSSGSGSGLAAAIVVPLLLLAIVIIGVIFLIKRKGGFGKITSGAGTKKGSENGDGAGVQDVVNVENETNLDNMPEAAKEDINETPTTGSPPNGAPPTKMEETRKGDNTPEPEQTLNTAHTPDADTNNIAGASDADKIPETPSPKAGDIDDADADASNKTGASEAAKAPGTEQPPGGNAANAGVTTNTTGPDTSTDTDDADDSKSTGASQEYGQDTDNNDDERPILHDPAAKAKGANDETEASEEGAVKVPLLQEEPANS